MKKILLILSVMVLMGCQTIGSFLGYTAEGMEKKILGAVDDVIEVLCAKPFEYSEELKQALIAKGINVNAMCR